MSSSMKLESSAQEGAWIAVEIGAVPVSQGHLQGSVVGLVPAEGHADLLRLSFPPLQGSREALVTGLQSLQTPVRGERDNCG